MEGLVEHLAKYAAYHRDPRNIATHFAGIPLIVLAVQILLAVPSVTLAGLAVSPMVLVSLGAAVWYLRLDRTLGLAMALQLFLGGWLAVWMSAAPEISALRSGALIFLLGWVFQFVGHVYEGRKPAFVDDLIGLVVGPLFVMAELIFLLGGRTGLRTAIEAQVGPVRRRTQGSLPA